MNSVKLYSYRQDNNHVHVLYRHCSSGLYAWSQRQVWSSDWGRRSLNPLQGCQSMCRCLHKSSGLRCCPAWSVLRSGHEWCPAYVTSFCSVQPLWGTHSSTERIKSKHVKQYLTQGVHLSRWKDERWTLPCSGSLNTRHSHISYVQVGPDFIRWGELQRAGIQDELEFFNEHQVLLLFAPWHSPCRALFQQTWTLFPVPSPPEWVWTAHWGTRAGGCSLRSKISSLCSASALPDWMWSYLTLLGHWLVCFHGCQKVRVSLTEVTSGEDKGGGGVHTLFSVYIQNGTNGDSLEWCQWVFFSLI